MLHNHLEEKCAEKLIKVMILMFLVQLFMSLHRNDSEKEKGGEIITPVTTVNVKGHLKTLNPNCHFI